MGWYRVVWPRWCYEIAGMVLRAIMQAGSAVCVHAHCVQCVSHLEWQGLVAIMGLVLFYGCLGDALLFRLLVRLVFPHCPRHRGSGGRAGLNANVLSPSVGGA